MGGGGGGGGGVSFCLAYFFFGLPIMHVVFFHASRACMDFFFVVYMLSLFYIATFYRRVMKCCLFLGIKNLQV